MEQRMKGSFPIGRAKSSANRFDPARGRVRPRCVFVLHLDYNGYVRFQDRCGFISRASPASQQKRPLAKRQPASPQKRRSVEEAGEIERKLPRTSASPRHIEDSSSMEEGESSAEESSVEIASAKSTTPVIAQSSPAAKAAESASAPGPSKKDDGFTTVGRNGKRIAPIVIDAQSNATELLTQIGNLCSNSSLQGRFENGKLRVFPTSAEEHRIIQKFVSDKKNAVAYIRDGPQ
ncbi:hypothetical protein TNCV_323841 [Trichonephila clavipes]|nr:hypothetical protein TNCV_323841 [Trichonephila clavipes]